MCSGIFVLFHLILRQLHLTVVGTDHGSLRADREMTISYELVVVLAAYLCTHVSPKVVIYGVVYGSSKSTEAAKI